MVSDQPILRIETGAEPVVVVGPVDVVLDVLFPAPDDFHRSFDLLGDCHGLSDAVNVEAAAEAAADKMIVHLDLIDRQSGDLRNRRLRARHYLGYYPDLAIVFGDMNGAIHGLQGGVSQE